MEQIPDKMKYVEDHYHILTKPMFEVFSVTIHFKDNMDESLRDGKPCHIHGIVRVLDEDGRTIELYNRKSNDLEIINLGGSVSLTNSTIIPFKVLRVAILLYDVAHDMEIALGVFDLDYTKPYDYNKLHTTRVDGEHGFALVYHSTFQHAVVACVEQLELCKNVGSSDPNNHLFGTVIARLKRTHGLSLPGDVNNHEYPTAIFFDNRPYSKQFTYVEAKFNTPIKLFRSCLAVPVDCSLIIEANFCDDTGVKFSTNIQFKASTHGCSIISQNCEMRVEGYWSHGYDPFPRETKVKYREDSTSNTSSESKVSSNASDAEQPLVVSAETTSNSESEVASNTSDAEQPLMVSAETTSNTNAEFSTKAQQPSSSISRGHPCASKPLVFSSVEVFSVLIHVNDNDLDIYGTIKVFDSWRPFYIFNGKETCCSRKTLSILGPSWSFMDEIFLMEVNLKDEKGRVVSNGFFEWFYVNTSGPISFHDRHMCSVIHGDIGYAVVHYSMFTYSLQARIRVSFVSCSSIPEAFVNVFGRITGEYSNYEYSTPYDQEFYKSTVFSKPQYDSVLVDLTSGSKLPLLKYLMPVPLENSLILDVNLYVVGPFRDRNKRMDVDVDKQTQDYTVISKLVEFKPNVDGYFVFERGDYVISICVEWSVGTIPPKDFSRPILPDKRSLKKAMQKASLNA